MTVRPSILLRFMIALALLPVMAVSAHADNPFGLAQSPRLGEDLSLLFARLRGLGVAWVRPPPVYLQGWQPGPCAYCTAYGTSGLGIALTVRSTTYSHRQDPVTPPADLAAFAGTLGAVLDQWHPSLVVVEQAENDPGAYAMPRADPVASYGAELIAACSAAHARNIPCTDGGITSSPAWWLGWLGLLNQPDIACDFAQRGPEAKADPALAGNLCTIKRAADLPAALHDRLIGNADRLLALYRTAPIDWVNFQWHGSDARGLAQLATSLARQTGKPVLSTEFTPAPGDTDPSNVRPLLRAAFAAGLKVAMWNADPPNGVAVFAPDGTLTSAGWEFQRQMSGVK